MVVFARNGRASPLSCHLRLPTPLLCFPGETSGLRELSWQSCRSLIADDFLKVEQIFTAFCRCEDVWPAHTGGEMNYRSVVDSWIHEKCFVAQGSGH